MNRNRDRLDIDDSAYIDRYRNPDATTLLLFIHGILGDHVEAWDKTPGELLATPALAEADRASFGYRTRYIDFSKPETVIDQFILWCKVHLPQYESIFAVAHSMGGLILRDMLGTLLRRGGEEHQKVFSAFKHCFLVATPLSGSKVAKWVTWIPGTTWLNRKLAYLSPPVGPEQYASYNKTIVLAENLGIARPRFSLFVGTSDKLVEKPEEWAVCKDDVYEGPVPGDHHSIKTDLTPNSTLLRRIVQVITDHQLRDKATQRRRLTMETRLETTVMRGSGAAARSHNSARRPARDIVLISCSASKDRRGGDTHPGESTLPDVVAHEDVVRLALQTRVKVMTLIQQGMIEGIEFKEGNRIARRENKELQLGPDFGGRINEQRYLPAYQRYTGRCYQATQEEWKSLFALGDAAPSILIMSGLYGLFPASEHIQVYDCHITDVDRATGLTIRDHWGEIMTDVLLSHLQWLDQNGFEIRHVIDLLSERSYQTAINWQRVYSKARVLHRIFEHRVGRDALANLGVWFRKVIREPARLHELGSDQFYSEPGFPDEDRIAFESRLGESELNVAREA